MENLIKASLEAALKHTPVEFRESALDVIIRFLHEYKIRSETSMVYIPTVVYELMDIADEQEE